MNKTEKIRGATIDRSDVFAFDARLFELDPLVLLQRRRRVREVALAAVRETRLQLVLAGFVRGLQFLPRLTSNERVSLIR